MRKSALPLITLIFLAIVGFIKPVEKTAVKCMIQLVNYTGEGAYVVVSLMNPDGSYAETLYVQGDDPEWYSDIPEWWSFYGKYRPDFDAIVGETVSGGERSLSILKIPSEKIDAGYSLRFETAVEDQEYYQEDARIDLTTANLKTKVEGSGFIRYVRLMPQQ